MPGGSVQHSIWQEEDCARWRNLLDTYPQAIAAQGSEKLVRLDSWYREELPRAIAERDVPCIYLDELQGIVAWKMTRGVWRERNRVLVASNAPQAVVEAGRKAFAAVPDPKLPLTILSSLAGVGAATASAVMSAYMPQVYPFFDEAVAVQVPTLGPVAFTVKYCLVYAETLRERAARLNEACKDHIWTPDDVAQALWAAWAQQPTLP